MSAVPYINGIEELTGRPPVGVCMSIGRKGDRGAPIENDRFYMVLPQEVDGVRPFHPSFKAFNESDPKHRTVMRGNLVHGTQAECFQYSLKAQVLPGHKPHPAKAPCCTGNSVIAQRWNPDADDGKGGRGAYQQIPCPASRCPFRQSDNNRPTPCRPFGRLLFRPRWPAGSTVPSLLCKWTTGSWNNVANLLGMFEDVQMQARALGLDGCSLYGLPIVLALGRKKRAGEAGGRSFPVVSASVDGDLVDFLLFQQKRLAELGGAPPAFAAITDKEQQTPAELAADQNQVSGPRPGAIDVSVPARESK